MVLGDPSLPNKKQFEQNRCTYSCATVFLDFLKKKNCMNLGRYAFYLPTYWRAVVIKEKKSGCDEKLETRDLLKLPLVV